MLHYKSNQPLYKLRFSELSEDAVKVFYFEGEESISRLFEYRFELVSEDPELDAKNILNKKATFTITRGENDPLKIHGIISHFEQRGRTPDYVSYYAVLVPKLWRTELIFQNEVYQRMDVEKLIHKVMETSGLSGGDYEIKLSGSYPEHEYVVQYQETNFNFLNRRLEHYGVFYYFDQREDNEVIVFTDSNESLPAIPTGEGVPYNPNKDPLSETETLSELTCREKVVTGLVRLKDYNYLHPEKQLMAESRIDAEGPGLYYAFGDHFEDESQGGLLARVRNEEFLAESRVFKGRGDCRLFHAGFKFTLGKHYRKEWNAEYVLTRMFARGAQRGLFGILQREKEVTPTYENVFEAIPVAIHYRPPRRTPVPRIPGVMSAKIESGSGDEYAFIDDHGRYRAKMLFDLTETSNGEATLPIRLSQAYSGSGYGMHFPNHAGTELVWACVDGNVDRPVGLGTVPNPSNASPSTGGNKAQSVIRSAGKNELTLDDTTGNENVFMKATKDHTVQVANDENAFVGRDQALDVGRDQKINVGQDQKMTVDRDREKTIERHESNHIKGDRKITVDGTHTETVMKDTAITIAEGKLQHRVAANSADYYVKGPLNEVYDDTHATTVTSDRTITVNGAHTEVIAKDTKITVSEGNYAHDVATGTASFHVKGAVTETFDANQQTTVAQAIAVQSNESSIHLTAKTEIKLQVGASKLLMKEDGTIELEGKNIAIKGMAVGVDGTVAVSIHGLAVTSKADANHTIQGAIVLSEGSAVNTIKGGMVMLNP